MDWYKIAFPEDLLSPFSEPRVLEKEVQEIYEKNGFPKGFTVYMEIKAASLTRRTPASRTGY